MEQISIEVVAARLGVTTDSQLAQETFQILKLESVGYRNLHNGFVMKQSDYKKAMSLDTDDTFCLSDVDLLEVERNKKEFGRLMKTRITLSQAYDINFNS